MTDGVAPSMFPSTPNRTMTLSASVTSAVASALSTLGAPLVTVLRDIVGVAHAAGSSVRSPNAQALATSATPAAALRAPGGRTVEPRGQALAVRPVGVDREQTVELCENESGAVGRPRGVEPGRESRQAALTEGGNHNVLISRERDSPAIGTPRRMRISRAVTRQADELGAVPVGDADVPVRVVGVEGLADDAGEREAPAVGRPRRIADRGDAGYDERSCPRPVDWKQEQLPGLVRRVAAGQIRDRVVGRCPGRVEPTEHLVDRRDVMRF